MASNRKKTYNPKKNAGAHARQAFKKIARVSFWAAGHERWRVAYIDLRTGRSVPRKQYEGLHWAIARFPMEHSVYVAAQHKEWDGELITYHDVPLKDDFGSKFILSKAVLARIDAAGNKLKTDTVADRITGLGKIIVPDGWELDGDALQILFAAAWAEGYEDHGGVAKWPNSESISKTPYT